MSEPLKEQNPQEIPVQPNHEHPSRLERAKQWVGDIATLGSIEVEYLTSSIKAKAQNLTDRSTARNYSDRPKLQGDDISEARRTYKGISKTRGQYKFK